MQEQYDPTRPPARERAALEKYFDDETRLMATEGYSTKKEALDQRKSALILLDQLTKAKDVYIRYLALNFFDRFASREEHLQDKHIQLAMICCISIAWKMTNDTFSVTLLLTNRRDLIINKDLMLEMEIRILCRLDWRLYSVNALSFLMYFLQMLPDDLCPSSNIVKEIIIQAERDIAFTQFRPSVIAASAVTVASVQFPGRLQECFDIIMSCNHVNKEELNRCSEMYREKRILGQTFKVGEASSSKTMEDSNRIPVKEPEPIKLECSETFEDLLRSPGKELVPETSETVEDSQSRPEEESVPENSETMEEIRRKLTFPEGSQSETMESISGKPGKETIPGSSDSEAMEEIKMPIHENTARDQELAHQSSESDDTLDSEEWSPIRS